LPDDLIHAATPCLKQMVEQHRHTGGNLIAVMDVPREQTSRYGVIRPGKQAGALTEVTGWSKSRSPMRRPRPGGDRPPYSVAGNLLLLAAAAGRRRGD
jgi:UTP--glucose-1-phosphate uridylyltransferase